MLTLLPLVLALPTAAHFQEPILASAPIGADEGIVLGPEGHRYRWVRDWLQLPDGMELGNTHGCVAVDSRGRVFFNTDSDHAIVIARPDGTIETSWGKEWKQGLHGMTLVQEGEEEFLYLAHTERHEVAKTTLLGEVIWTMPWPEISGKYESAGQYKPTSIVTGPDGEIFIADGYGQSWVHRFSKDREYLGSFGGYGSEPGKMKTPHGMFMELGGAEPYLVVCDRENGRLQRFAMDGKLVRAETPGLRRPCNGVITQYGWAVADLAGRVTLLGLDESGERVVLAQLGDNPDPGKRAKNGVPREQWADGEFLSPHGIGADADGNLYVQDWNRLGRITKLERIQD
ncbi:NHL repeat protein [Planctomycetes bacterium Poly30]|uniref:NHL repeat protein n=1 Tax=Saltatorellus ferox TaxID=2528018 RepID=A0A518ETT8_9BACT|nr:NHL repeat protein [Planctomycetes bacterium Poly30]